MSRNLIRFFHNKPTSNNQILIVNKLQFRSFVARHLPTDIGERKLICVFPVALYGIDGWVDGWMDGWMDGWIDGWIDRWMDGKIDTKIERWMD